MIPVVAFIGPSGAGKTGLIVSLIQLLRAKGYRVGVIKHSHHSGVEIDHPGKDSDRLRRAGADPVLFIGPDRLMMSAELSQQPRLGELATRYFPDCDLVLVEGFSEGRCPKIVVQCGSEQKQSVQKAWDRDEVIARVTDSSEEETPSEARQVPSFSPGEPERLAQFLQERFL